MCSYKQILLVREPSDLQDRGRIDRAVLIDASISLRDWLIPDDVARGKAHDDVDVIRTFRV